MSHHEAGRHPPRRSPRRVGARVGPVRLLATAWLVAVLSGCDAATAVEVLRLDVEPEAGLVAGLGETTRFLAIARGAGGVEVPTDGAEWSTDRPSVATVDRRGVVTGVSEGEARVTVRFEGFQATATVEVYAPPVVTDYEAGVSYLGRRGYVEYIPGELSVVLSAPHGGDLTPEEIADRVSGVVVTDTNTRELTFALRDAFLDLTGKAPHVVVSHLHRGKLDPNREIEEAALGDPFAERAWEEYHAFIETARTEASVAGEAMYFDIHGHGHPKARLELGYLLSADRLNGDDQSLNSLATVQLTSIREIGRDSPLPFSQLLRGPTSLGGLLQERGVPAVPSPAMPSPGSDPYFSGGYSTRRHGSLADTERVSGIQIEHHYAGIRDSDANRRAYAALLAEAVRDFMLEHIGRFDD